ncbi:MAG: FtsQ-type POTRA domain-containing protein [SAR324 cluster bacterium]|nr:FtsQ-type POTRA domain-containing protein [SAR324 cluster bacterium]MED5241290.1 FtsQ-type POTRA domain-containing protein [SAR324 cluster bacterium]MEE2599904.1 FtsQ-type POTRA domain-containing protein [SAR324 cluster bacterium]
MQDLKRQSNRRPAVRKLRLSPSSIRKNRSNPMPGLPVKLSKPNAEPSYINSWIPPYFVEDDPAFLQMKIRWLIQKFIGFCGLVFILWLSGGSIWVGKAFFQQPLKKVLIKGNQILDDVDVLRASGLHQGQRLYDLEPYRLAERLQTHPIVQKADVRRKFPDEIHLNITEYQPFALLAISKQTNVFSIVSPAKKRYVLISKDQRILKKLSIDVLRDSPHKNLPLIDGVKVQSIKLGTILDSPVLERGLRFLKTFQQIATEQKTKMPKTNLKLEGQFKIVDWNTQPIHIDISDPLNLKINWPLNIFNPQPSSSEPLRTLPLTIQMGSRNFDKRLRTFQNIYPVLDKQHPGLKSIDLRYKNRIFLVP